MMWHILGVEVTLEPVTVGCACVCVCVCVCVRRGPEGSVLIIAAAIVHERAAFCEGAWEEGVG